MIEIGAFKLTHYSKLPHNQRQLANVNPQLFYVENTYACCYCLKYYNKNPNNLNLGRNRIRGPKKRKDDNNNEGNNKETETEAFRTVDASAQTDVVEPENPGLYVHHSIVGTYFILSY